MHCMEYTRLYDTRFEGETRHMSLPDRCVIPLRPYLNQTILNTLEEFLRSWVIHDFFIP